MSSVLRSPQFQLLSREQKVLLVIHSNGKSGIHLSGPARQFEGIISKVTLIKILEKLKDWNMIEAHWTRINVKSRGFDREVWVRSLIISDEAIEYVKRLYELTQSL